MPTYSNAVFCEEQTVRERRLRADLDAAANQYHEARHNYLAAVELQAKPWYGQCDTAKEAVRRALVELNRARAIYGSTLRTIADLYARPEDLA
jgi:hypothetical protein